MRFILSVIGVIIVTVIAIVLIATSGNHSGPKPINLTSYNNPTSSVTFITSGEVVGDELRQAVEISISQNSRNIYILNGYNETVSSTESFSNNSTAYGVFLGSLQDFGFANSRKTNEINMFGVCPLGQTYQYQLSNSSSIISNLWGTSCSVSDGNFNGIGSTINQLFQLQISNYNTFTQNLNQYF